MTVKDLIWSLQQCEPSAEVHVHVSQGVGDGEITALAVEGLYSISGALEKPTVFLQPSSKAVIKFVGTPVPLVRP